MMQCCGLHMSLTKKSLQRVGHLPLHVSLYEKLLTLICEKQRGQSA